MMPTLNGRIAIYDYRVCFTTITYVVVVIPGISVWQDIVKLVMLLVGDDPQSFGPQSSLLYIVKCAESC